MSKNEGTQYSTVDLELVKDYEFKVKFNLQNVPDLIMDEPSPVGQGTGPNASRVLAAAVGNCLSASLLFCLRKARINVEALKTTVTTSVARNQEGYWRVKAISVRLQPTVAEDEAAKMERCLKIFENYCVVTQSVRKGIDVDVKVV